MLVRRRTGPLPRGLLLLLLLLLLEQQQQQQQLLQQQQQALSSSSSSYPSSSSSSSFPSDGPAPGPAPEPEMAPGPALAPAPEDSSSYTSYDAEAPAEAPAPDGGDEDADIGELEWTTFDAEGHPEGKTTFDAQGVAHETKKADLVPNPDAYEREAEAEAAAKKKPEAKKVEKVEPVIKKNAMVKTAAVPAEKKTAEKKTAATKADDTKMTWQTFDAEGHPEGEMETVMDAKAPAKKSSAVKAKKPAEPETDEASLSEAEDIELPALFEDEVFRGDIVEGVTPEMPTTSSARRSRTTGTGRAEDLELKHFHFHITTEVTVKGTGCPKIDTDVFGDVIHDFVKRAQSGDADVAADPLEKLTARNSAARVGGSESDLAAPFNTMTVGACTEGKTEDGTKMHSFEVSLVVTREDPSTNPHPAMDALKNVFSTAHAKAQLEKVGADEKTIEATEVTVSQPTVHGKIAVVEKPKEKKSL